MTRLKLEQLLEVYVSFPLQKGELHEALARDRGRSVEDNMLCEADLSAQEKAVKEQESAVNIKFFLIVLPII